MPKLYKNVVLWDAERESASLCDVLTEGAEIAKIAPAGTLDGEAAFDGRGGTAMLPGFVNAHQADAAMAAFRIHHGPVHPAGRYGQPFRIGVLGPRPRL